MVQMRVAGIGKGAKGTPAVCILLLEEIAEPKRHIAVPIGSFEAKAIATSEQKNMPLIYNLTTDIITHYGGEIEGVNILFCDNGLYKTQLYIKTADGEKAFDCRLSDAVALALRQNAPIYINEDLLEQESSKIKVVVKHTDDAPLEVLTDEELQSRLNQAIKKEDYEQASVIQKEINKRKNI